MALMLGMAFLPAWAQHPGTHGAGTHGPAAHGPSGHPGAPAHGSFGGNRFPPMGLGGRRPGLPQAVSGVVPPPAYLGIRRPSPLPYTGAGPGSSYRQPYDDGHHRRPYHSPRDHDHDRWRDRDRGNYWADLPYTSGWVTPWIPTYPLVYGDDFDADSDQAYYDQAYYDQSQPYPGNAPVGQPEDQALYPYPSGPAPYTGPYTQPYAVSESSNPMPAQARAPYRPPAPAAEPATPPPSTPVTLVFKDGRPPEKIHNFLLTARTLSVLDQHRHDIPVAELDLEQTAKVNREAGVDFQIPGSQPSPPAQP